MGAVLTGAPLSKESMHALFVEKRLTTLTFEEEMAKIKKETEAMPRTAPGAATVTADEQLAQQDAQRQQDAKLAAAKGAPKAAPKK